MTNQQQEMIEYTTQEVVRYLIEYNGMTIEEAMEQFYLSWTFEKLNDIETGLYLEGSAYIYEMLKREQRKKTEIESVFKGIDGTYVKRTFDFSLKDKEIDDSLSEISKTMDNCTTVKLVNYYPEYRKNVNKNAETIATKIM